jgi:HEAT repeat protein
MNREEPKLSCDDIAGLFVFYLCNELEEDEQAAVDRHVAQCESCHAQLQEERNFADAIGSMPQAADQLDNSGVLLSQCRSELAEKLDDLVRPAVKDEPLRFGWFRRFMILHPAWSGAALVIVGLVAGTESTQWMANRNQPDSLDHAVNIRPSSQITDEQLSNMAVAGINITPSGNAGSQNVRLQLSAEEPVVLSGSLDDGDVRRVLTYVVKNGERFNPGVRLDCLEALKSRSRDKEVRGALLEAARKDMNPAVRLKALEALRDASGDQTVRQALLETLQHDTNPGVRVEAVNLLVRSLEDMKEFPPMAEEEDLPAVVGAHPHAHHNRMISDEQDESMTNMVQALEELQHKDPSRYVRLQSRAALRQIGDRQGH